MSKPPADAKALADKLGERHEQLEAVYAFRRVVELELHPVRGNFDAAHLKEVNRRVFQDLPGAGLDGVTPGEYRQPVPAGLDWMKQRGLSIVEGAFYVACSRMDEAAKERLDIALDSAKRSELSGLSTPGFTTRLAHIYTATPSWTMSAPSVTATAARCAPSPRNWLWNRGSTWIGSGLAAVT